jgi:serine/threonine protein phosphatase PrpC
MSQGMPTPSVTNPPPAIAAHAITHGGRTRSQNEDAFGSFVGDRLFIVADGMGGHHAGEIASQLAVDEIVAFFRSFHDDPRQAWPFPVDRRRSLGANLLTVGMKVANQKIRAAAEADRARAKMACTAVTMAIGDEQVSIAHAGDARAYRLRGGALERLTTDHSILAEMIAARPDMGRAEIAAFSHRSVVTKSLGSKPEVEPALYVGRFHRDDLFLLCSDGLWDAVDDQAIGEILRSTADLEVACQLLIDAANDAGGRDNITALVARVG